MSLSEWKKVDFKQFINDFGIDILTKNAPTILFSKKDKEHEAYNSLIAFFFVASALLIYIAISLLIIEIYFSIVVFITVIVIAIIVDIVLILNYVKSNVYIKPIECLLEIFNHLDFYCFSFYIVYSGKSHPNKAKSIIYKLYQEEVLKNTIDITPIEVYLRISQDSKIDYENLGFFFEYGEGELFENELIDHDSWQFFSYEITKHDNYIAVANWAHQYEWRNDLELDFDKLHNYAPWIIKVWDQLNLKPITEEFEADINWKLRYINPLPKLKPWDGPLKDQVYEHSNPTWENDIIANAIKNVIGNEYRVETLKDLKIDLFELKAYFRDLDI